MLDCKNKILVLFLSFVVGLCIGQAINIYVIFGIIPNGYSSTLFILLELISVILGGMYIYWAREVLKGKYKI